MAQPGMIEIGAVEVQQDDPRNVFKLEASAPANLSIVTLAI